MTQPVRDWHVREGTSGILTLQDASGRQTYVPDYDLDKARQLLLQFQELPDARGLPLRKNYRVDGTDWFPSTVSLLYWWVFFPYVKYAPLVHDRWEGRARFRWDGKGMFASLLEFLGQGEPRTLGQRVHSSLFRWINRREARRSKATVLFFEFSHGDFRTAEIGRTLEQLGAEILRVVPAPRIGEMLRRLWRGERCYYYSQPCAPNRGNRFGHTYQLEGLEPARRRLFSAAIQLVEATVTSCLLDYEHHLDALRGTSARIFYGLDEINGHVFPVLYACQQLGLRTIGHQHGAYVRRHAAYVMEGIDPGDLRWFDRVIVWGSYWRDKLLALSRVYPPEFFLVGSNKHVATLAASPPRREPPYTILIPFEFLTNTAAVGKYLARLIDLGYSLAFKPRPDETLDDQLDCYCLPPAYRGKLRILPKLDDAAMAGIDIIAGTMTTLIYELLSCGKIIWIFETEYRHLEDLVEEGLAHKVRYEDLATLDASYFTPTHFERERLFGHLTLEETLRRYVLPTHP